MSLVSVRSPGTPSEQKSRRAPTNGGRGDCCLSRPPRARDLFRELQECNTPASRRTPLRADIFTYRNDVTRVEGDGRKKEMGWQWPD
jgi:hypothetical protein